MDGLSFRGVLMAGGFFLAFRPHRHQQHAPEKEDLQVRTGKTIVLGTIVDN